VPTDFAAARQLLAAAGFPRGAGLPGIELQADNYIEQPRVAEVIQETWRRELGVRLQIAVLEAKTKIQNRRTGNYAISFSMWNAEFADPASFLEVFVTNGGNNVTRWSHPGYDRLIAEAAQTLDPARRFEVFQQAEALLLEEAPIAPVFFDAQTYLVHPAVRTGNPPPSATTASSASGWSRDAAILDPRHPKATEARSRRREPVENGESAARNARITKNSAAKETALRHVKTRTVFSSLLCVLCVLCG